MARKRNGKQQTARGQPLPSLDDPLWILLIMAHHIRSEQLIGARFSSLAGDHLMEALKSGKLRCMRESRTTPSERQWVPASFWYGLRIDAELDVSLIQILRGLPIQGNAPDLRTEVYGWAFYVWKPDFDKLWPSAKVDRETTETSPRRKPGPPPTHEWPTVVAAEVIRRIKAGERDPTAAEMIEHCENTFPDEFSPGLKEMQVQLRKLLLRQF